MAVATAELPRADPDRPQGALTQAYVAILRTPPGRWFAINIAAPLDKPLMRYSGGRLWLRPAAPVGGADDARGEARRRAPRGGPHFHDGEDVIVIASSFGRDTNPAWYSNLRTHPECGARGGGGGGRYVAEEITDPAERDRIWAQADKVYPGCADYRARVRAIGRKIPILRLRPAREASGA